MVGHWDFLWPSSKQLKHLIFSLSFLYVSFTFLSLYSRPSICSFCVNVFLFPSLYWFLLTSLGLASINMSISLPNFFDLNHFSFSFNKMWDLTSFGITSFILSTKTGFFKSSNVFTIYFLGNGLNMLSSALAIANSFRYPPFYSFRNSFYWTGADFPNKYTFSLLRSLPFHPPNFSWS